MSRTRKPPVQQVTPHSNPISDTELMTKQCLYSMNISVHRLLSYGMTSSEIISEVTQMINGQAF